MATGDHPQYKATAYQAKRPRYKSSLVGNILAYHQHNNPAAATELGLDVATGTGIFARQLVPHFTKVVGTDISKSMLQTAREAAGDNPIEYVEASSENLMFLNDRSVDVITVATGAHWFNPDKFVREARRVLKPSGTLAIFGYSGLAHFVDHPQCDDIVRHEFLDPNKLGKLWSQGLDIVIDGYRRYHEILLQNKWIGIQRSIYPGTAIRGEPSSEYPPICAQEPVVMNFEVTWRIMEDFWKTTSAVSRHVDMFPDRENPATVLVRELMAAAGASDINEMLRVQWEETLLMCHPPRSDM
ncbi:trans-aconitate methyltransferase 1 [Coemansia sp. RSA 1199]|nr:trans-aconitate methyltransferase 1 [Coemansia sp. RSA 1199]